MTSFYGHNIHAQGVKNQQRLIDHIAKTKPAWLVVMDGLALAQQLKAASPTTNVIHRNYGVTNGDEDVFARVSPQAWLDLHKAEIDAGVWLMTTCEPGWGQDVIDWHIALMKLCIPRKIRLVVGNWSVGTPEPALISLAKPMFQLMDANRDLFVLGIHEYANAVITSGFTGGAPDGWTEAHDKQYHIDYQRPSAWPLSGEARVLTKWHCGRFQFIVDYCKSVGINPPRMALTECGFDDVSDIKWWTNRLPRTDGYPDIRGFKTLPAYWKTVFPDWSVDRAYFEQLKYAEENIYLNTPVEGGCIYCYGHVDPQWQQFDIEGYNELLGYLEAYALSQVQTPNYTPSEFVSGKQYQLVIAGTYRNVRETPGLTTSKFIGQVNNGAIVTALDQRIVDVDYWWRIKTDTVEGWVSLDGGRVDMRRVVDTPPVVILPPPANPPAETPKASAYARLYAAQLKIAQAQYELAQLYKELDEEGKLSNAA